MVTNIVRGAWDDLISVFKVKNCIEVSTTRLRGIQGRWYIRMGVCGVLSPSKIWKFKLKSPAKLINQDTVIFVTEKIISILKSSKIP